MEIAKDCVVSIDYTLTNAEGQLLDKSHHDEPLSYLHGADNIIPGLEQALEGKAVGDSLEVTLPPADAYGERDEAMRQEVSRDQFEDIDDLEVGARFRVPSDAGDVIVTVVEINEATVTIDGNHELAGETLNFSVTVTDIRAATEEELEHGHAHGAGGHHH